MKKLFTLLLGIVLILPLYSRDDDGEKKSFDPERKHFEIGWGAGGGFDNALVGLSDILQKKIVIDFLKIAQSVPEEGAGSNFGLSMGFFVNIKNISLGEGLWDFGFVSGVDGGINLNTAKSLFELIAEGNADRHDSSGSITVSGGIFTELGLRGSAKYEVAGRTLYVGVKPTIFTPAIYIPSSSGIYYDLSTKNEEGDDGLFLRTRGELEIYTASSMERVEPGRFIIGPSGFDLSLEGEYAFFPFLDVGASFTNIPIAAAALTNQMSLKMVDKKHPEKDLEIGLSWNDLIGEEGNKPETPEIDFYETYKENAKKEVRRPFRFDVYGRYKPLQSELLVIKPNVGFTVNATAGDEKAYFNAGLEVLFNWKNLFIAYIGSGYKEAIWRQRLGLGLNVRAFELGLEAALRNQTFEGCFMERGFEFNLGMRFGW
jgi:hypothetical protein